MYSGRASGSGRSSLISESSRTCAAGPISRRRTIKERSRDRPCVSWARTQVSFSVGDVYVCVCVCIRKRDPVADLQFMAENACEFFCERCVCMWMCVYEREILRQTLLFMGENASEFFCERFVCCVCVCIRKKDPVATCESWPTTQVSSSVFL